MSSSMGRMTSHIMKWTNKIYVWNHQAVLIQYHTERFNQTIDHLLQDISAVGFSQVRCCSQGYHLRQTTLHVHCIWRITCISSSVLWSISAFLKNSQLCQNQHVIMVSWGSLWFHQWWTSWFIPTSGGSMLDVWCYPLVIWPSYWKWPFIVDLPINNGAFP